MRGNHSKYHSANAFCGNAGPEEMQHLNDLIDQLSDEELKYLVKKVGISFAASEDSLDREDYELVIDETDREDFYREYRGIINSRKKTK